MSTMIKNADGTFTNVSQEKHGYRTRLWTVEFGYIGSLIARRCPSTLKFLGYTGGYSDGNGREWNTGEAPMGRKKAVAFLLNKARENGLQPRR